jgi:EamA-like transporter family protein
LAVAGSLVAYLAYFWLLNRFPPTLIATHTYVNPLVALILGWAIAGEALTVRFVFGGVIVIAAIALVGRATSREAQVGKIREQQVAIVMKFVFLFLLLVPLFVFCTARSVTKDLRYPRASFVDIL